MNSVKRIAPGALRPQSARVAVLLLAAFVACFLSAAAQTKEGGTVMDAFQAGKLVPGAVFFKGQSANTQARNSGGVHFADGQYALAVLVDTSGYTSAVQQKYQGYLLTEVPLEFGSHRVPPGAYGFGFVKSGFLVMDIGGHELLTADVVHDQQMHRPMPLQILAAGQPSLYRLCSGRDCVRFERAR